MPSPALASQVVQAFIVDHLVIHLEFGMETRILVVDDDRELVATLKRRLELLGCLVSWVTTPEDCFSAASTEAPHMILLASELGTVSGSKVCNGLRRDPELGRIPVVMMTSAAADQHQTHETLPTHADAYVAKSEDMREVIEQVRPLIARRQKLDQPPPPSSYAYKPPLSEETESGGEPEGESRSTGTERLELLLRVPAARVAECETLEVVAPPPSEPHTESHEATIARLHELVAEQTQALADAASRADEAERRVGELEAEIAFLEQTVREQAAHIAQLEGDS